MFIYERDIFPLISGSRLGKMSKCHAHHLMYILYSIEECLCIHTPPSEVHTTTETHTQPTLFPTGHKEPAKGKQFVPEHKKRLWFPKKAS